MRLPTFYEQNLIPNWGRNFDVLGYCDGEIAQDFVSEFSIEKYACLTWKDGRMIMVSRTDP